jgi:hypothetical protein
MSIQLVLKTLAVTPLAQQTLKETILGKLITMSKMKPSYVSFLSKVIRIQKPFSYFAKKWVVKGGCWEKLIQ